MSILAASLFVTLSAPQVKPSFDDLSYRAFTYFVEASHPRTGFTKDRSRNFEPDVPTNRVASIAAMGFTLSAYAIGEHRGWMPRSEAVGRARHLVRNLMAKAPRDHGWFYHFFDWETGKREWNCEVSTIDTSIFLAGLLMSEMAFQDAEFTALSQQIQKEIDWKWAITRDGARPNSPFVCMGFRPEQGFLDHDWASYNELPMLYVQAYGLYPQMPKEGWDKIERPQFHYKGYDFLAGGPLFMHQMSHVFVDFKGVRDPLGFDYWVNSRNAILANRQYCIDNPKGFKGYEPDVWGLSASDSPKGYEAQGAPGNIYDNGTITPSSAIAAAMFDRKTAEEVTKGTYQKHPGTYGKYGFTIAFNPTESWMSPDVIGIDLGQLLLSLENARDGFPNRMSMKHPVISKGMKLMGFKATSEGPITSRKLRIQPKK